LLINPIFFILKEPFNKYFYCHSLNHWPVTKSEESEDVELDEADPVTKFEEFVDDPEFEELEDSPTNWLEFFDLLEDVCAPSITKSPSFLDFDVSDFSPVVKSSSEGEIWEGLFCSEEGATKLSPFSGAVVVPGAGAKKSSGLNSTGELRSIALIDLFRKLNLLSNVITKAIIKTMITISVQENPLFSGELGIYNLKLSYFGFFSTFPFGLGSFDFKIFCINNLYYMFNLHVNI
jgi:hypothetical protein